MTQSYPVVNGAIRYVNGLQMSYTSTSTITIQAGRVRDFGNINDIVVGFPPNVAGSETGEEPTPASVTTVVSTAFTGPSGLDTGTVAASTFYAVYAIGDSFNNNPGSVILSKSAVSPLFPIGYNLYRRIGYILTDSSSHILNFWQYGNGDVRDMWYDVGIAAPTTAGSTGYANISLATSVPVTATEVFTKVTYTPASAANIASFLPYGSTATNGIEVFGYGVAAAQQGMLTIITQPNATPAAAFQYKTTSGSDTLVMVVAGYRDYLLA